MWFERRCLMMGHGRSDRGLSFFRRPEVGAELGQGDAQPLSVFHGRFCRNEPAPFAVLEHC